jgi:hypothetical protein
VCRREREYQGHGSFRGAGGIVNMILAMKRHCLKLTFAEPGTTVDARSSTCSFLPASKVTDGFSILVVFSIQAKRGFCSIVIFNTQRGMSGVENTSVGRGTGVLIPFTYAHDPN